MITYGSVITPQQYNDIVKSVGWEERKLEQAEAAIKNSVKFVAYADSMPIGLTRVISDGGYHALVADVMVMPQFQGRGIGKNLMSKAVDYLKSRAPMSVTLVSAKGREGFYEQFGFIARPTDERGCGMSLYL